MDIGKGQQGSWCWEVTKIKLRKTDKFGNPYTGVVDFNVVCGELFMEGLHCDELTFSDGKDFKAVANLFGHTKYSK